MTKTAKKRNILQSQLVEFQGQLNTQLTMVKQLKIEKELAFDLLTQYKTKWISCKKPLGQMS